MLTAGNLRTCASSLCRRPPRARLRRRTGCPPPSTSVPPPARPTRPNRPSTSARTPQGDDCLTPASEAPTPAKKVVKDEVFGDSVEDEVLSPLPAAHPTHRPDTAPFHQHTVECIVDPSNGVVSVEPGMIKTTRVRNPSRPAPSRAGLILTPHIARTSSTRSSSRSSTRTKRFIQR